MNKETKITSEGIRKVLKNYTPSTAFTEYIWNGFDANASEIDIEYKSNSIGSIEYISIQDNGTGIDLNNLSDKFEKFYDSEKAIKIKTPKNSSTYHGKNGVGRLTFFLFAHSAEWNTTFADSQGNLKGGKISIDASNLKSYNPTDTELPFLHTGTKVTFNNIIISDFVFEKEILPNLIKEFSWFLELKNRKSSIRLNGQDIAYDNFIVDREKTGFESNGESFEIEYVQWRDALNKEQSKYYYLNSDGKEVYKEFTSLNRKGDKFHHSIYVRSEFFNDFYWGSDEHASQGSLIGKTKNNSVFKELSNELSSYLRSKKRPLLRKYGEILVNTFESQGVLPKYNNAWENLRLTELKEVIVGIYEVQPKIFIDLNIEQKKTFVRFLDLLLDSNEREHIFEILDDITTLNSKELHDLASLLKSTKLNRVISMLKLIEDRYRTFYQLQAMVFNPELGANEVKHVQSMIESHYWIFGEEYNLVSAAEPKFEEALRRYCHILQTDYDDNGIDHPYKLKEMDIFMCRQDRKIDKIHNIVVELKHPNIKLGDKELSQVKKYMNIISQQPEFNASNMTWDFILVGNSFNKIKEIEQALESASAHGERSLAFKTGKYKIYVKTWSEIFTEFELKHQFLDTKLRLERSNLTSNEATADAVLNAAQHNTAIGGPEVSI